MPKRRILIVDDEPDVRTILRATLAPHYEVVEAQDGAGCCAEAGCR